MPVTVDVWLYHLPFYQMLLAQLKHWVALDSRTSAGIPENTKKLLEYMHHGAFNPHHWTN